MSEVILAKTAGYCFGVTRAVKTACDAAEKHGTVYSLGELIHNNDAVEELRRRGVIPVEKPESAKGCIVIRSHGVPRETYRRIGELGLECVDATCPYVARIHAVVDENSRDSDVLIIGDAAHPEVIGIKGFANSEVRVASDAETIEKIAKSDKIFGAKSLIVVVQTTFDMCKWTDLQKIIKKHYTNLKIFDTICRATYERQQEAEELSKQCDAMIIVGGAHSSTMSQSVAITFR